MAENPTRPSLFTGASVPPASTKSARSSLSNIWASIMASAPDAQAETGAWAPPWSPKSMATWPAGASGISIGTVSGLTRDGPPSESCMCCSCMVDSPPIPVPITTATRSGSSPGARSKAMAQACRAANNASCEQRSARLRRMGSSDANAESSTRPAMRVARSVLQRSCNA